MRDLTEDFATAKIWPLVFKLVIPAVIAQLITFFYNLVDRMYVSNIAGIQTQALAALGIVLPITLIVQAFANLIGLGASPKASMAMGEGDKSRANRIFNLSFAMLFGVGILMTVVLYVFARDIVILFGCPEDAIRYATEYLRIYALGSIFIIMVQGLNPFISAQGHSFIAMGTTLLGALLNVGLDPLFIFTFGMGVEGAALATILSQLASFIWLLLFFYKKGSFFRPDFRAMKPDKQIIGGILFLGLSPFIMTLTEGIIQIVFNVCLKIATGGDGSTYTAALTIMLSALQLISLPLNGLGYGIAPFVSYNYGKGDAKRLKEGIKDTFLIALLFGVTVYLISMFCPELYAFIFSAENDVFLVVKQFTPFFLMGTIMFTVQMTLQNINVALGQGKTALFLAVLRKVIILIPLCFILTYSLGYSGVYLSEGIADLVAGVITTVVIFVTFSRVIKKREIEVEKSISEKNVS